jgi:hypothetical protein
LGCSLTCGTGRRGWNVCMVWQGMKMKRNEGMKDEREKWTWLCARDTLGWDAHVSFDE